MPTTNKGLGRGLSALLDVHGDDTADGGVTLIDITQIDPDRSQPRRKFDAQPLGELAESIKAHGVISPLALRSTGDGRYRIIAGERRWRAARMAGIDRVPAVIIDADDRKARELALVENLQREDLSAIEEGEGFRALIEEYGLTQDEAAARVGRSRPAVANTMRLLALPDEVKRMVGDGSISAGHARTLLALDDRDKQIQAAQKMANEAVSVRQAETMVRKMASPAKKQTAPDEDADYIKDAERELSALLAHRVTISGGGRRGKMLHGSVQIGYYGNEGLNVLIDLLRSIKKGDTR